jgi:Cu/Ag efflux protein CusF
MTRYLAAVLISLALAACAAAPEQEGTKYPLKGEVKALDASAKSATIEHEKIGDWMDAMTMEFAVKPDSEFAKLHVGDRIEATVVVNDVRFHVTDVKVTGRAETPPTK